MIICQYFAKCTQPAVQRYTMPKITGMDPVPICQRCINKMLNLGMERDGLVPL